MVVIMTLLISICERVIAIAPRTEPLETPVDVVKEQARDWSGNTYMETKIIRVDNPS
jgi:hypothetical protein